LPASALPQASEANDATASAIAIDVRGLTKRFGGRPVVDHVSIRVQRGAIFGFLGPNGSGKTTTIRMLCGLLTPDEGEGTCLGFDLRREAASIKREVGYMTQRFSLYEDLSIEENLDFIARMYAVPQRRQAIAATLDRLGLTTRRAQLAGTLSGGWKQRLALAGCMLHSPRLLLLDEPTAGVDPKARRDFWEKIHELAAEGITVLVSTHYMDEAERCHRLGYINYGKLLVEGTPEQVIAHSGLATWRIALRGTGDERLLAQLAHELGQMKGIDTVIPFGTTLRVAGRDAAALERALAPVGLRGEFEIERTATSLEDVFVNLMQGASADGNR
jgi:ABC-2 type transport system ATP-binding protein